MKDKLKQEEKDLLVKDLLPRIPYNPMVKVPGENKPKELRNRVRWMMVFGKARSVEDCLEGLIPYLRPMSSMTEGEHEKFENLFPQYSISEDRGSVYHSCRGDLNLDIIDWLNAHHFDYRGLERDCLRSGRRNVLNYERKYIFVYRIISFWVWILSHPSWFSLNGGGSNFLSEFLL